MILTKYIKADTSFNGKLRSQFDILSPGNIFLIDSIKKKEDIKIKYRSLERTQTFKSSPILVPHLTIGSRDMANSLKFCENYRGLQTLSPHDVIHEQPQGHNRRALVKNEVQREQEQEIPRRTNVHWPKVHREKLFLIN